MGDLAFQQGSGSVHESNCTASTTLPNFRTTFAGVWVLARKRTREKERERKRQAEGEALQESAKGQKDDRA